MWERQRDRETKDSYYYDWHHVINIFRTLLLLWLEVWYRTISKPEPTPPIWQVTTHWLLPKSICWLRISCHYIIFLTPTHSTSGSQFTWFISTLLFTQVHILFRNWQLICCQKSICNMSLSSCHLYFCSCSSVVISRRSKFFWAGMTNNVYDNNSIQHYSVVYTKLNALKYCYVILIVQLNINHLFANS